MVIVQIGTKNPRPVEDVKTSELQRYRPNKMVPYIAAYFKIDSETPSTFVIGDGKNYTFNDINYSNNPLKQNSSYIVFLRFFESEVNSMLCEHAQLDC